MPTLKVGPDNTIQYVTSDGNVLSEVEYDSNTGHLRFVDDTGSPAPAEFGETVHKSLSTEGITHTSTGNSVFLSVAATGQSTLASGTAVVDTGLSATGATFYLALGVDDPNADTKISGRLFWDDAAGTYKVELVETETSVGNPTVNYDILRVR